MKRYDIDTVDMGLEYYDLDRIDSASEIRDALVWVPDGIRLVVELPDGGSIDLDFCLRYLLDWYSRVRNGNSGLISFAHHFGRISVGDDEVSIDYSERQVDAEGNERLVSEKATICGSPKAFQLVFEDLIVDILHTLSEHGVDTSAVLEELQGEVSGVDLVESFEGA